LIAFSRVQRILDQRGQSLHGGILRKNTRRKIGALFDLNSLLIVWKP
jgi:hypothetical protein